MLIDRIDLYHVAMPLIYPWKTAYGEDEAIHSVLCRLSSGSLAGWGESAPFAAPCYSPEWAGGLFAIARDWLAPAVIGHDIRSGEELQQHMSLYKGNPFAKAALDVAWWGLESRRTGTPLHRLLGASRDQVPVGADFGVMDHVDDLIEGIAGAVAEGFPRVKLKFRPGWDLPMLRQVRETFPETRFHIDCNSGYTLEDRAIFEEVDQLGLAMIEQPLQHDDLLDHATLQQELETPICLDESIVSVHRAQQACRIGACGWINIKPGRVGGLTNAVAIHDVCRQAEIPCWVGGMLESATGSAACVALAMLDNFSYPADIFPSARFYHQDMADPPLELVTDSQGQPSVVASTELPDPVTKRLEQLSLQKATIK
jgi:O-succinylbenzoate synthase